MAKWKAALTDLQAAILAHLIHIRGAVDRMSDDMHDIKLRLGHLETNAARGGGEALDSVNMEDRDKLRAEQGRVLRAAKIAAGFGSAAKAVKASPIRDKWTVATYRAHEAGTRTMGQDDAERYAKFFRSHGAKITAIDILFPNLGQQTAPIEERS
jgi:hypothetical protein